MVSVVPELWVHIIIYDPQFSFTKVQPTLQSSLCPPSLDFGKTRQINYLHYVAVFVCRRASNGLAGEGKDRATDSETILVLTLLSQSAELINEDQLQGLLARTDLLAPTV